MKVKRMHLRELIDTGRAVELSPDVGQAFDEYLGTLRWTGTSLDWSRMGPSSEIDVRQATPTQILAWAKDTALGRHSHLMIFYAPGESVLAMPLECGIENLDMLYWDAPGVRFAFGGDFVGGKLCPAFGDILQYGGGDLLIARL